MRCSNIELLRIISMYMILCLHAITQSHVLEIQEVLSLNWCFSTFMHLGGRMAVTIFIICGAWFLVDGKFKFYRIIRLYFQHFFWLGVITFLCWMLGYQIQIKEALGVFFPITFRLVWFVSFYIILLCFTPFLNKFFDFNHKCQAIFLGILTYIIVIMPTLMIGGQDAYSSTLLYMIYIYILTGYIKHHIFFIKRFNTLKKAGSLALLIYSILFLSSLLFAKMAIIFPEKSTLFNEIMFYYVYHFETLPSICCAYSFFFAFYNLKINPSLKINYFASLTLGIYIIHQTPVFYPILWNEILCIPMYANTTFWPIYFFVTSIFAYFACALSDVLWTSIVSKYILSSHFIEDICIKIDATFNDYHDLNA